VTDAARPEIPKGGLVLVWKVTRNFAPGDIIAHAGESKGRLSLGRIDKQSQEAVFVKRNNSEPTSVLHSAIVGKVISVVWRGTQEVSSNSMNLKEWEGKDGAWMYYLRGVAPDKGVDPTTYFELKEPLPAKKWHQFLSVNDYAPPPIASHDDELPRHKSSTRDGVQTSVRNPFSVCAYKNGTIPFPAGIITEQRMNE
jgi:hypothetical protein